MVNTRQDKYWQYQAKTEAVSDEVSKWQLITSFVLCVTGGVVLIRAVWPVYNAHSNIFNFYRRY